MTMSMFAETIQGLADGPRVGDFEKLTETLMRRFHEKGLTLAQMADRKMMSRSVKTLEGRARKYGLAFPDYVPPDLRKRVALVKGGKVYHFSGPNATAARQSIGLAEVEAKNLKDAKAALKKAWFVVEVARPARKAKPNG